MHSTAIVDEALDSSAICLDVLVLTRYGKLVEGFVDCVSYPGETGKPVGTAGDVVARKI